MYATACHAIACHRAVNAAGQEQKCLAAAADRQTACTLEVCPVNKCVGITDLYHYSHVRMVYINGKVRICVQQDTAQLCADLRRLQRKRLVRTLCLYLKRICTLQNLFQIRDRLGRNVLHGLFADASTAQRRNAKDALELFQNFVQVDGI